MLRNGKPFSCSRTCLRTALLIVPGVVVHEVETGKAPVIKVFFNNQLYNILSRDSDDKTG